MNRQSSGFTLVELLLVIITISILAVIMIPNYLDFRKDAKIALAKKYIGSLKVSLVTQKKNSILRCSLNSTRWPRKEAIELNDITENGSPEADCNFEEIPNPEDRKFLSSVGNSEIPENPINGRRDIVYTTCTNLCTCNDLGGYLYNRDTGDFGHKSLLQECATLAANNEESSQEEESSSEESSQEEESSSEESSSSECLESSWTTWDVSCMYCVTTYLRCPEGSDVIHYSDLSICENDAGPCPHSSSSE